MTAFCSGGSPPQTPPPLFDLTHCGGTEVALRHVIIPYLARRLGQARASVCTFVINPYLDLGLPFKTAEKGIRRINDRDHEGLCPYFAFSVKDLSVATDETRRPGCLRVTATPRQTFDGIAEQSLFEENT